MPQIAKANGTGPGAKIGIGWEKREWWLRIVISRTIDDSYCASVPTTKHHDSINQLTGGRGGMRFNGRQW